MRAKRIPHLADPTTPSNPPKSWNNTPAWNKGKAVGPKAPLTPDQVKLIRDTLAAGAEWRDLALFGTAIDTMLRAADLLKLRVADITDAYGAIVDEVSVQQQKTGEPHRLALSAAARMIEPWQDGGTSLCLF